MTTGSFGKDRNSIICTACGAANPPGSRFCERCGTRLPQQAGGNQPTRAMPAPPPTVTPPSAPETRPEVAAPVPAPGAPPTGEESAQQDPVHPTPDATPAPFPGSDSPTVTIELMPVREIRRDAPTETFELPREGRPASDTPAASQSPGPPQTAGDQPTELGSGWNYRSWTPPPGGTTPPPAQSGEPPMPTQPREAPPTSPTPPAEVTQVIRPAAGASGVPQGQAPAQEEPSLTAPATAPITYPSGNAPVERQGQPYVGGTAHSTGAPGTGLPYGTPSGGAPPPTGYMANAGQFPAPANGTNNRTLWIILGVIGGLALLCVIICLLIVVVAAVSSSNTSGVATSVATATRR